MMQEDTDPDIMVKAYGSQAKFADWFQRNEAHWQSKLETLAFHTATTSSTRGSGGWRFSRSCAGCSGIHSSRITIMGAADAAGATYGRIAWHSSSRNLKRARFLVQQLRRGEIDGSNATIIGSQPGEFMADRNNIPRIWMDHGAWPFLTTQLYIDQTGDLAFLLQEQTYFKDPQISRRRNG